MSRSLLLLVLLAAATVNAKRVIRAAPESRKTGNYIVQLERDVSHERFEELREALLEVSVDHRIHVAIDGTVAKLMSVKLRNESVDKVSQWYKSIH